MSASALAVVALASCGQSPYDARGDDPAERDGAGLDALAVDANPLTTCPSPCVADAVADLGGAAWQYRVDERAPNGLAYAAMVEATVDGVPARAAAAGSPPAILDCRTTTDGACTNAQGGLVLLASPRDDATGDPVLAVRVPAAGRYRVSGFARALGTDGALTRVLVSRRSRNDLLFVRDVGGNELAPIEATVEALEGDLLLLTVQPAEAGTPRPLAISLFVSEIEGPLSAGCELAMDFDGATPLVDACKERTFTDRGDPVARFVTDGPNADYGDALHLDLGAWLRADGYVDYDTDPFTMQAWLRLAGPPSLGKGSAYGDDQCLPTNETQGGLVLYHTGEQVVVVYSFDGSGVDGQCQDGPQPQLEVSEPTDGEWHLYRFVRDHGRAEVRLCLDGRELDAAPLGNSLSMTSGFPPTFGRDADFGPAGYEDDVDDFRIVKTALPCL